MWLEAKRQDWALFEHTCYTYHSTHSGRCDMLFMRSWIDEYRQINIQHWKLLDAYATGSHLLSDLCSHRCFHYSLSLSPVYFILYKRFSITSCVYENKKQIPVHFIIYIVYISVCVWYDCVCKRKLARENRKLAANTSLISNVCILYTRLASLIIETGKKVVHFMAASVSLSIKNGRNGFLFYRSISSAKWTKRCTESDK